ncbi:acyltransferase [Aeromonas dhakensis]|uniref:acyltransferase n=1 Tax=Aeromonas dhakensis TaxID=196024 RepID=UPI001CF07F7F|nr:acyltransferase [Aeromonas dhakensis]UCM52028.1 acyltransferase [Aeromonas dhakensis]
MKRIFKNIISGLAFISSWYYIFLVKLGIPYKHISLITSSIHGYYGISLRRYFYKRTLIKCGCNLKVHYGAYICYPSVEIGDNCTIEEHSVVSLCSIGNDVIIAANVSIMSGKNHHEIDDLSKSFYETQSDTLERIFLGDNLWIGTRATIMANVSAGTVIGAAALVNKTFEENSIIAGNPARVLRKRGM